MQILGNYASSLSDFQLQELEALLKSALAQGEYAGGDTFDTATANNLVTQAKDFNNLPVPSAGQRAMADTVNNPYGYLVARLNAIQSETDTYASEVQTLISLVAKDTALLDQLLAAAALRSALQTKPQIANSTVLMWDYAMGFGYVATELPSTDPSNGVTYPVNVSFLTALDATNDIHSGIGMPSTAISIPPKSLAWTFTSDPSWQSQVRYGNDWAELDLLLPKPVVDVSTIASVTPSNSSVQVTGTSNLIVPINVRLMFVPRFQSITLPSLAAGASANLSLYGVADVDITVLSAGKLYAPDVDFTVLDDGTFTSIDLPEDQPILIYFTENWPAFQCSIDSLTWSQVVMLDSVRSYPDNTTEFAPITKQGSKFAITDELGVPTGLMLELVSPLLEETVIQASSRGTGSPGLSALLEIEMSIPQFMTALSISPATDFPASMTCVEIEGFSEASRQTVWTGSVALDRPMVIRFARNMVKRVYLTMLQENYTLEQYQVSPPDQLRRSIMYDLQTSLPTAVQRPTPPQAKQYSGAQYSFAIESIAGEDITASKGVFVAGGYPVAGCPEVIRFDMDTYQQVNAYLCYEAFNSAGLKVDENLQGVVLPVGAMVFPFSPTLDRTTVASVNIYFKFVPATPQAVLERYFLQLAEAS